LENQNKNKLLNQVVDYVLKYNMIRTCQTIEIGLLILSGMLIMKSLILASLTFIGGMVFAIVTGEAMIKRNVRR